MTISKRVLEAPEFPNFIAQPLLGTKEYVTQISNFAQLIRFLEQLSMFCEAMRDQFEEWIAMSNDRTQKITFMRNRMMELRKSTETVQQNINTNVVTSIEGDRWEFRTVNPVPNMLFTVDTMPLALKRAVNGCYPLPEIEKFDAFREDGNASLKLYSYPQFFFDEWKKLMLKESEGKKKKKKTRKTTLVNKTKKEIKGIDVIKYTSSGEALVTKIQPSSKKEPTSATTSITDKELSKVMGEETKFPLSKPVKNANMKDSRNSVTATVESGSVSSKNIISELGESSEVKKVKSTSSLTSKTDPVTQPTSIPPVPSLQSIPPPPPMQSIPPPPSMQGGPPPPPMMQGGPPPPPIQSKNNDTETTESTVPTNVSANLIQSVQLKKSTPAPAVAKPPDARDDLLTSIRKGEVQLKKVEKADKPVAAEKNDVAAILMRRAAMEVSDSSGSDESEKDDWE